MIPAHQVVERALAAAVADETIVLVTDTATAALRWAGNTMTTNGVSTSRQLTVISIVRDGRVARVGSLSTAQVDPDDIPALVAASAAAARGAPPSRDA
ncbi:MAG: TldD/PmbA family protein, partial [Mycolicibacterium sp.]|nr:TldD/PmbA family protein [Mycolicibacterium sp.]